MKSSLHIKTKQGNGRTVLDNAFFTPPFKLANITEDKGGRWLHLMVMNSSPGVLDGDEYDVKIELAKDCSMQLHTQSYQRLFNMKTGALQTTELHMEAGSSFIYLPHPSVPHHSSIFSANNKIYVKEQCSLAWGEILTCGRKLNGEVFQFGSYHSVTEVFFQGRLIIKENLLMEPARIDPMKIGQLEGYTHQASFLSMAAGGVALECMDEIHEFLNQQQNILFGITATQGNGMLVRILGNGAELLHDLLRSITFLSQQYKAAIVEPINER